MEEDSDLSLLSRLREWTKEQVDCCKDAMLLDLVYKILLNG